MAKKTVKATTAETPEVETVTIEEAIDSTAEVQTTSEPTLEVVQVEQVERTTTLTKTEVQQAIDRLKKSNPTKYEQKRKELEMLLKNAK
jgi:hypothetical protein